MTIAHDAGPRHGKLESMRALDGTTIVVTRPAHQARRLAQLIEQAGGTAVLFPTIEIVAPEDLSAARRVLGRLASFDLLLFISANAVSAGLALAPPLANPPPHLRIGAVGKATADALAAAGIHADLVPRSGFSGEALLELDTLQELHGQHVLIVRGVGGRELLGNSLRARGADVAYAEVYRRRSTQQDPRALLERWRHGEIDAATVTSSEVLASLVALLRPGLSEVVRTPLVVLSGRTAAEARHGYGFTQVLLAPEASDAGIVDALKAWRGALGQDRAQGSPA